ncbi:hypothetical protein SNOG_02121 [Parastagonospora nodorum SN15]|uniref:Peroxin/Ferlin domain-containing protein n=1 Tax=Phaeosphaeria nodorum (strain SN15 / ATCC MYA-4574 / FGSC 10173) TaxID=321614 RepID=Q0V1J3_PHANO|nr:hypothetical protein SNOG_02121 [Parastagonospora nodorum SN15]EAT90333.2 hypothetical protein SNOG_02121 [Parastagonospora nodorum SN15]
MSSPSRPSNDASSPLPTGDPNPPTYASFTPSTLGQSTPQTKLRSAILVHQKSPLLAATPPQITRVLAYSHPFILPLNKLVGLLTWTTGDPWESFLLVASFWAIVMYGDAVTRYAGPIIVVSGLILGMYTRRYSPLSSTGWTGEKGQKVHKRAESESDIKHHKSLEDIVDMSLSWHSRPARVTRTLMWRSRMVRKTCAFLTGLDFGDTISADKKGAPPLPPRKKSTQEVAASLAAKRRPESTGVRFTFSIYENQRRWLGIGWTSSMLAYERASWTDEHLNAVPPKDQFELPEVEGGQSRWRWVQGSSWKIETGGDTKTTTKDDAGWIYYDNKWRDGRRGLDGWGRYTRRRKWYRDAELVESTPSTEVTPVPTPKHAPVDDDQLAKFPSNLSVSTADTTLVDDAASVVSDTDAASTKSKRSWFKKKRRSKSTSGSVSGITVASAGTEGSRRSEEEDVHSPLERTREDDWRGVDDIRQHLDI